MLRAVSLKGRWMLRPYDKKKAAECTSWFEDHDELEIDIQDSILTSLIAAGAVPDGRKWPTDNLWTIKRSVCWDSEGGTLHAIIKLPDAIKIRVNGSDVDSPDVTGLLREGENVIEALVPGCFSGEQCNIFTSSTGLVYSAHFRSRRERDGYRVTLALDYLSYTEHREELRLELLGEVLMTELSFGIGRTMKEVSLFIPGDKVQLWNVNGDGKQSVHRALIDLGPIELERKLSFRDIEVRDGKLYVNGEEFFAKGAVWPVGRFRDRNRIEALIGAAKNANMNLLYIPKGHEENFFYNECDRKGIIVLHEDNAPSLDYHPSFLTGDVKYDIFNCIPHDTNYFQHILDAVALERFMLKTRSSNETNGVIYDGLLSTVTPEGKWKPAHYCTRRFYADLVPIMFLENGKLCCYVSNDSDRDEEAEISIKFMTYEGKKRDRMMFTVNAPAHTAVKITEADISDVDTVKEFVFMKLRTFGIHRELTLLLDNISSCGFALPEYQTSVRTISPRSFSIRVKASKPAFAVHLNMRDVDGSFSDSFFEVRPESEKSVVFTASRDMAEAEVLEKLEIYDLAHALEEAGKEE